MAYIGECSRHGQYMNRCDGCDNERPLHSLVERIKAGDDPDMALKSVLDLTLTIRKAEHLKESEENLKRQMIAFNRAQWIQKNLPPELRDDGPRY